MSKEVRWHKFSERKPKKNGKYLWALNNWDCLSVRNKKLYTVDVSVFYWDNSGFWLDNSGNHMIDPDEWAVVPKPKKAIKHEK